jgi:hypothetical protein
VGGGLDGDDKPGGVSMGSAPETIQHGTDSPPSPIAWTEGDSGKAPSSSGTLDKLTMHFCSALGVPIPNIIPWAHALLRFAGPRCAVDIVLLPEAEPFRPGLARAPL